MSKKVIDTNILLNYPEIILTENCVIPSTVISELENIKTSGTKSEEVRFKARQATRLLSDNEDKYTVHIVTKSTYDIVEKHNLPIDNDNLIIASCLEIKEPVVFVSNDLCARLIASGIFEVNVESYSADRNKEEYKGYKEVTLEDCEMANFYENLRTNNFDCLENEYVIIKDANGETKDIRRWTLTNGYVEVFNKMIKSAVMKAKIKPKDEYQQMTIDSIFNNTMTVISGKAGSGKSLLALTSAMNLIELGKYEKLVIMYNPVKVKGAADSGYFKGTALEKAMQNGIGEILRTKFNDTKKLESMIMSEQIKLLSMADCRGTEVKDNEILWITESQNMSIELMKICLSRCSQNAKIIIEGDYNSQVDNYAFENNNNGMKRAIEVLKGENIFGYVELQNVWRSKIASLVEKL